MHVIFYLILLASSVAGAPMSRRSTCLFPIHAHAFFLCHVAIPGMSCCVEQTGETPHGDGAHENFSLYGFARRNDS